MLLSEAIKKRQQLLEKGMAMDAWRMKQEHSTGELKWIEMKIAIGKVIDVVFEEYHRYNDAIENDIQLKEIEISPFNVK